MGIKIVIPSVLRPFTNNMEVVEVKGSSVSGCLDHLVKQFPDIEKRLFAENDELNSYVGIYVNGENAYAEGLAKPVEDGDELHIVYIVDGG
ncbi:MoaD/ThiS family protein [Chloroflexota bacterium]